MVLGTDGHLELRRRIDSSGQDCGNQLFVADAAGTEHVDLAEVRLNHWSDIVHDVRANTRTANPQGLTVEAMRLALLAQQQAERAVV